MLRSLTIENFALIDALRIDFSEGLNTITGETGAGKSLLLGALSLVLGGKGDVAALRDKEKNCVIEAEFGVNGYGLEPFFEENDIDYAEVSTLRRVINPAGKSRFYVNDLPVGVTELKELGARLIDVHSQHQTLLLANNRFQIDLIDSVAGHDDLLASYRADFSALRAARKELYDLRAKKEEGLKEEEYLRFQAQQLAEAKLREGEQEELEALLNELTHAAEIREVLAQADALLSDDQAGILPGLKTIDSAFSKLAAVFPKAGELAERVRSAALELKDIAADVAAEAERVDLDPEKLERTEQRLDLLYSLQQKHRVSDVTNLVTLYEDILNQLARSEGFDVRIDELETDIARLQSSAAKNAEKISKNRRGVAGKVEKYVVETCAQLGMPNVRFSAEITPGGELGADGTDSVRFLFTANKNAPLQPVEQVASGGEMSRLMMALKSLVARHRQLPTLIFDEIDTGISGEIAHRMGEIIWSLAAHLQVINITHLPQVASKGDHHYLVYKEDDARATNTRIRKLTAEERVTEIAKMLSGSGISNAAVEQARLLLRQQ